MSPPPPLKSRNSWRTLSCSSINNLMASMNGPPACAGAWFGVRGGGVVSSHPQPQPFTLWQTGGPDRPTGCAVQRTCASPAGPRPPSSAAGLLLSLASALAALLTVATLSGAVALSAFLSVALAVLLAVLATLFVLLAVLLA